MTRKRHMKGIETKKMISEARKVTYVAEFPMFSCHRRGKDKILSKGCFHICKQRGNDCLIQRLRCIVAAIRARTWHHEMACSFGTKGSLRSKSSQALKGFSNEGSDDI
eukprot:scaffold4244_cov167-Amphora_coffeaeformis.AAC.37